MIELVIYSLYVLIVKETRNLLPSLDWLLLSDYLLILKLNLRLFKLNLLVSFLEMIKLLMRVSLSMVSLNFFVWHRLFRRRSHILSKARMLNFLALIDANLLYLILDASLLFFLKQLLWKLLHIALVLKQLV